LISDINIQANLKERRCGNTKYSDTLFLIPMRTRESVTFCSWLLTMLNYSVLPPDPFITIIKNIICTTTVPFVQSRILNLIFVLNLKQLYILTIKYSNKIIGYKQTGAQFTSLNLFTWYCALVIPLRVFTRTRLLLTVYLH
jgi:hypothetical protein